MNGTTAPPPEHAGWFDDAHNLLVIAEHTPGLPLPSISGTRASFNYTGITHAKDAREAVALAETILSYAFKVEFVRDDPPRIGSSAHYVLTASLPSGLPLSIVALAAHYEGPAVPVIREPELAVA